MALHRFKTPSEVAEVLDLGLATVYRVRAAYLEGGVRALCDHRCWREYRKVTPKVVAVLIRLVEHPPDFATYGRSTWTTGLLAQVLEEKTGIGLDPSWVWQLLQRAGYRWKRTRPVVRSCNPVRRWQWAALVRVLRQVKPGEVILFEDEADLDLNPKTGHAWCLRGEPAEVETPGRNQKWYLAGALNVDTGTFIFVDGPTKRSVLFVALLEKVSWSYRYARRIHLLVDGSPIHDSRMTHQALDRLGRIVLHHLPSYSPEYNPVERVWGRFHNAVTRNHRFPTLKKLVTAAKLYLSRLRKVAYESPLSFKVTRYGLVSVEN